MSNVAADLSRDEHRVSRIIEHLQAAARGDLVAENISEGLYLVECHGTRPLSEADADAIWYAAINAAIVACEKLPPWIQREHVRRGIRATLSWVDHRRPDTGNGVVRLVDGLELRSWMRVLRNECHSAALIEQMAASAEANAARQSAGGLG